MKRLIALFVFILCCTWSAGAQDLIVKTNAAKIEAKVMEITPEVVRYKRFSNPDGPTYVLPVGDIRYIQYKNGEKETFAKEGAEAAPAPANPMLVVSQTAPAEAVHYVAKSYEIGEYYDEGGLKGVVCVLSEDKLHGLILSLQEIHLPWSTFQKSDLHTTGITDRADGAVNMLSVAKYIADNNLTWADFPAFNWCREQGEGWYFPAVDEMLLISRNYNGGTRMLNNRQARVNFNETLKDKGGMRMDRLQFYFSSTEIDAKSAYCTHMTMEPPYVVDIPKNSKWIVRAVHKF
ncbi:MAG: hypothetical protein RSB23_08260 [Alistipes sp.]